MDIDQSAPIKASASVEIAAPAYDVWAVMTEFHRWSCWNPQIKEAKLEGPLEPGSRFVWRSGPGAIRSVLRAVDPPRELGWSGKTMGIHAQHVWRLEPTPTGVKVTTEESWRGWPTRAMRKRMTRVLDDAVATGLENLKTEAERRVCWHGGCPADGRRRADAVEAVA
jgi:uncharacterized protein YndB with AHSA1/START domain